MGAEHPKPLIFTTLQVNKIFQEKFSLSLLLKRFKKCTI